jgi:predicted nucleic acid-binding protein
MATTAADQTFVDTNVLVYASVKEAPLHALALSALDDLKRLGVELWINRQVLREYLAVLTRPQAFAQPIPISTLIQQVQDFEARFHVADEDAAVTEELLVILGRVSVGGKQVHDANIAASMRVNGVRRLLTHNVADFTRFSQFLDIVPLQRTT